MLSTHTWSLHYEAGATALFFSTFPSQKNLWYPFQEVESTSESYRTWEQFSTLGDSASQPGPDMLVTTFGSATYKVRMEGRSKLMKP